MEINNKSNVIIREISIDDLCKIKSLWHDLYMEQVSMSPELTLAVDAFDDWSTSLGTILGRFGFVLLAECDDACCGFIAGRIKVPTPPFQSTPVGFISELYVEPSSRGLGIGKKLLHAAERWFRLNEIETMELQVVQANSSAYSFYQAVGWKVSLLHMTRLVSPEKRRS